MKRMLLVGIASVAVCAIAAGQEAGERIGTITDSAGDSHGVYSDGRGGSYTSDGYHSGTHDSERLENDYNGDYEPMEPRDHEPRERESSSSNSDRERDFHSDRH